MVPRQANGRVWPGLSQAQKYQHPGKLLLGLGVPPWSACSTSLPSWYL